MPTTPPMTDEIAAIEEGVPGVLIRIAVKAPP